MEIKKSSLPNAGLGVFTKKHVKAGTILGPYKGVKVPSQDCEAVEDPEYLWEVSRVKLLRTQNPSQQCMKRVDISYKFCSDLSALT